MTKEISKLKEELNNVKLHKKYYFSQSPLTEDQLLSSEETGKELSRVTSTSSFLFTTELEATMFASELLKLDENKDVSHYKLISNFSRTGSFTMLEPVLKESSRLLDLVAPSEVLSRSVYLASMEAEINRLKALLNAEYRIEESK